MPTSADTLIERTRRFLRDWPEEDVLTASISSSGTTLTVADATLYKKNWLLELDQELVTVTADGATTDIPIRRGARGSTAASHVSSTVIVTRPHFFSVEILDALNDGLDACFPLLYRPVANEYTGILADTYEYDLPNMSGISVAIPYLYEVEVQEPGDDAFRKVRSWEIVRSANPFIKFRRPLVADSTIRLRGYGPFTHLSAITDELDEFFPTQAEHLLPLYAASYLLGSGEAGRVRVDTGVSDNREQANRVGSSLAAGDRLLGRFYTRLNQAAMPPLPRHVKAVL